MEILEHTLEDSIKLLPFLIVTYLIMEACERAAGGKAAQAIAKAGPAGPVLGAALGAFPQCGFSAAASNFYSAGLIGMGTLIAVFLSTSDEMLPIFIAQQAGAGTIAKLLIAKVIIATVSGYFISIIGRKFFLNQKDALDKHREEHGHDCSQDGHGLVAEALIRSAKTFAFIFVITFVLNGIIHTVGEEFITSILKDIPVLGEVLAALVGLIPNCASSILISQLYLSGMIGAGAMMSGLLVSAGVGILVLFEENHNVKENMTILLILYVLGVLWGLLIRGMGITF